MREIIEELRASIEANKVDPAAVAPLVSKYLPRTLSFCHTGDSGYVSGNVIAWWTANHAVKFSVASIALKGWYKLDALHTVLPTVAKIGVRVYTPGNPSKTNLGYLIFTPGVVGISTDITTDFSMATGDTLEFYVETLAGVNSITVALDYYFS